MRFFPTSKGVVQSAHKPFERDVNCCEIVLTSEKRYDIIPMAKALRGTISVAVASRFSGKQISFAFPMRGGDIHGKLGIAFPVRRIYHFTINLRRYS